MDPLSYLHSLEPIGIKFGLEAISALVERLGNPERSFRAVHIAGTNGKGSVTAMVDAALGAAGHHTGRYTSPHLIDLTERFAIDGRPVTRDALISVVSDLRRAIDGLLADGGLDAQPTFFEVTTAAAFELFRRARIDIGVVEVGLGGRLDATNLVHPLVTAITSITFDHERFLGATLREIAAEKAGILKPHVPVVVGDLAPEAARTVDALAARQEVPVVRAAEGVAMAVVEPAAPGFERAGTIVRMATPVRDYGEVVIGLRGAHQIGNAVVAVRILEALDAQGVAVPAAAIIEGLARPSWPGRLDLRRLKDGREVLLDAAHNPAGAAALASYLHGHAGGPLPLVFAVMRDKDVDGMLRMLLPTASHLIATRAPSRRSAEPADVAALAHAIAPALPIQVQPSPADALAAAWCLSPRIVVAGSIFLLGAVLKCLE